MTTDPSPTITPTAAPSSGPDHNEADRAGRRVAATLGVIVLGAFWWIASGPSDGIVTLVAGLGFAAIAAVALLDAALDGPDPQRK
jgi:hypothetical protein